MGGTKKILKKEEINEKVIKVLQETYPSAGTACTKIWRLNNIKELSEDTEAIARGQISNGKNQFSGSSSGHGNWMSQSSC